MGGRQKILFLASSVVFLLFLVSYKFSLLHETTQLPYLASSPIPLFQRIATYAFMLIGIFPTILLILYTSILCTTTLVAGTVTTMCFGSPFAVSDSSGFFAYLVAGLVSTVIVGGFIWFTMNNSKKITSP